MYSGEFKADRYDGRGKMVWGNGDVYEGGWAEGKQEGEGKERLVELEEVYEVRHIDVNTFLCEFS